MRVAAASCKIEAFLPAVPRGLAGIFSSRELFVTDRVVVFVDYQNLHGWAKRCFLPRGCHPADGHVDPLRLSEHLVGRRKNRSTLQQVRIYRGVPVPDHEPKSAAANERQAAAWSRSPLVDLHRRPLRYPASWTDKRPGYRADRPQEKGVDVELAVDLVRLAMQKWFDAAIVVSDDTDLVPALQTVYELRLAHVEIASWAGGRRVRFPNTQLPWCHTLSAATFQQLRDTVDYSIPDDQT